MIDLKKVLFCNISWMKKYAGITKDDIPFSGTEYVQATGDAFEKYNFLEFDDGYQYGFVETKHHENEYKKFNLTNFGEEFKDQNVASGILVVFFARNPKDLKFYIVGYYKNADVLRIREFAHHDSVKEPIQYNFRCKKEDSVFIEVKDRVPLNLPKDIRLFHQQLFIYPSTKEYASICTKIVENLYKYDITRESGYLQYYHQSWIVPLRTNITGDTWLPQTNNDISAGDYIYIYIGAPINAYKYKCIVNTSNIPQGEVEGATSPMNKKIKLIGQIHVPLKEVFDNVPNVSIAPQSQRQLSGPYLELLESALLINENKKPSLADLDDQITSGDTYDGEISSTPRPPITRDGVKSSKEMKMLDVLPYLIHKTNVR